MLLGVCLLLTCAGNSWKASAVSGSLNVTEDPPIPSTEAGEGVATAALVLSVLALVLSLVSVLWLALRKASPSALANLASGNSHQSVHPSAQFSGGPPKASFDTDVYMNYSCTNRESMYSCVS